ncbi:MAG: hypothetical protein ORN85_10715 [Sediminibacterium sp.]|nr:hypothetical protein [Sediminibacterium sp.]
MNIDFLKASFTENFKNSLKNWAESIGITPAIKGFNDEGNCNDDDCYTFSIQADKKTHIINIIELYRHQP